MDIRTRQDNEDGKGDTNVYIPFKNCEVKDFENRKYSPLPDFLKVLEGYMCPDFTVGAERFGIQGRYTDLSFRSSFSVEIHKCNPRYRSCKSDDEIRRFLETFYFTMYILKPRLMFSTDNLLQNPLVTEQEFYSQFALNFDGYRDNNNLIEVHNVKTYDHRLVSQEGNYRFFDLK